MVQFGASLLYFEGQGSVVLNEIGVYVEDNMRLAHLVGTPELAKRYSLYNGGGKSCLKGGTCVALLTVEPLYPHHQLLMSPL